MKDTEDVPEQIWLLASLETIEVISSTIIQAIDERGVRNVINVTQSLHISELSHRDHYSPP